VACKGKEKWWEIGLLKNKKINKKKITFLFCFDKVVVASATLTANNNY
jgi:hypothetical protein